MNALEIFAPLPLQDGFDNAGLQIGLTDAEATGALLCLDVTEAVVDEAIALGYNLIVSHHPLIFKGYKSITGRDYVERCILKAIKNDIVIFSMHTNLDNAPQGVNFKIAEKIGLKNVRILEPKENQLLKLVTFVPKAQADEVRNALFEAGCSCIGNYDSCSYNLEGKGTFRAQPGTHPFCGEIGQLHEEHEVRIETVLPAFLKGKVQKALVEVHPYEEPAYDFYPLQNEWTQAGAGIIGELEEPETETDFLRWIEAVRGGLCKTFAHDGTPHPDRRPLWRSRSLPAAQGRKSPCRRVPDRRSEIPRLFQLRERYSHCRDRALRKRTIYKRFIIFNHTGKVSDTRRTADACQYQSHKILVENYG